MRIALVLLLVTAGCGKADEALKAMETVRGEVCGCKPTDVECQAKGVAKLAAWHQAYDEVMAARSQAAKATAATGAMRKCQTNQLVSAIAERAGCKDKDAKSEWCKVKGWGDAKAVEAADLPFGKAVTGVSERVTIGVAPTGAKEDARIEIGGDAKAPTASGMAMKADGASWTWEHDGLTTELRHLDHGWMTLEVDGDTRHVGVFAEPE